MHTTLFTDSQRDHLELSRHAAERYAVLTAITDRRSLDRRSSRPQRAVKAVPHLLAIDGWFRKRRLS